MDYRTLTQRLRVMLKVNSVVHRTSNCSSLSGPLLNPLHFHLNMVSCSATGRLLCHPPFPFVYSDNQLDVFELAYVFDRVAPQRTGPHIFIGTYECDTICGKVVFVDITMVMFATS